MACDTLHTILLDQTRYIGCEDLYLKVMQAFIVHGEGHDVTTQSLYDMTGWLYDNRRYSDAIPLLLYLLNFYKNKYGYLDDNYLKILNRLAFSVFITDDDNRQVEYLFRNELKFRILKDGYDNGNTIYSMLELANYYKYKKQYTNAQQLYTLSFNLSEQLFGSEHQLTLLIKHDYVRT